MPLEIETPDLLEQFEEVIRTEDKLQIREFLNNQNISDVAELVDEYNEYASQIIGNMSIHRAASVFKILDVSIQKKIIQELPPSKTAELLNELPADDRTAFLEELPSEVVKELIKTAGSRRKKNHAFPSRLSRRQCGQFDDARLYRGKYRLDNAGSAGSYSRSRQRQ